MLSVEGLCMGCMGIRGSAPLCSLCGWREGSGPLEEQQLRPRTILFGKYLVGRVLGQGGFGITYIAWDLNLDRKLAVKEYFPAQLCTRRGETTVAAFSARVREDYEYGLKKFLEEGRTLARLDHPGIVDIFDYFGENGTAYLVMKYLEGETLAQQLKKEGRLSFAKSLRLLTPIMDALRDVHVVGLLHRDVSPENIYLCHSGQVKLIDFGAARNATAEQSQSVSVILKQGYAPLEQYQSHGRQGPWTDVYALAATFYRTITGQIPPEAPERLENDPIQKPSRLGVAISAGSERALMKGLAVRIEDRFQDVMSLEKALVPAESPPQKKLPWKPIAGIGAALLVGIIVWAFIPDKPTKKDEVKAPVKTVTPVTPSTTPELPHLYFPPLEKPKPRTFEWSPAEKTARIENLWADHDVVEQGMKGMLIHLTFSTIGLQSDQLETAAFVYFDDPELRPVKAALAGFRAENGQVIALTNIDSSATPQPTKQLFLPYGALSLPVGRWNLKYHVLIRMRQAPGTVYATSDWQKFWVNRTSPLPTLPSQTPVTRQPQACCCEAGESPMHCFMKCNASEPPCG